VVALYENKLDPAIGVSIRYRVIKGPLLFSDNGKKEIEVKTDSKGIAFVNAKFTSVGTALVVAELKEDPNVAVFFEGHTAKTTHQIFLYSATTFPVDPGVVVARIVAVDHHSQPVTGAKLVFEGSFGADTVVSGEVKELGNGEYEGRFQTRIAGPWTILAQDVDTKVTAHRCIHLLPSEPHTLRLVGETDPRMSYPYGELLLCVRLEDRFMNALNPHRIRCTVAGQVISPQAIVAEEAHFSIHFIGYGFVDIELSDSESSVSMRSKILFAAAWLQDPGTVFVGSKFNTVLYGAPEADRPIQRATVEIKFNPRLVSFLGLEKPPPGGPALSTNATVKENLLTIEIESEKPVSAQEYPEGIPVCTIVWKCLDEGKSCFTLVANASPSSEPWEWCVDQKRRETKCICINVIHRDGDAAARTAGTNAANQIPNIISSNANVAQCCPIVRVDIHYCAISAADWANTVVPAIGAHGQITSLAEFNALRATGVCKRPRCINLYMIPFDDPDAGGRTNDPPGPPGDSALHPGLVGSRQNVGAHELAHTLGLHDLYRRRPDGSFDSGPADNLMSYFSGTDSHGTNLTRDQCRTIWQNIDNYPC